MMEQIYYYSNALLYIFLQIPNLFIGILLYPFYGNIVLWKMYNLSLYITNYLFINITILNQYPILTPHILLVNHTTYCDTYLGLIFDKPYKTIIKKQALFFPIIGQLLYMLDMIFVDRDNTKSKNTTKQLIATNAKQIITIIFPQGTREPTKRFNNNEIVLKKGSIEIAIEHNIPIVLGYHNLHNKIDDVKQRLYINKKVYAICSNPILLPNEYNELPIEEKVNILYKIIYDEFIRLEKIVLDKI